MSSMRKRPDTGRWEVRWRDSSGHRSRSFNNRQEAKRFYEDVESREKRGAAESLNDSRRPLEEFVEEWWRRYAMRDLAENTRKIYASMWDRHARPEIGQHPIDQITPAVIAELRSTLHDKGLGNQGIVKTLTMLQSVFRAAVEWDVVSINPVAQVRKPSVQRKRVVRPLTPQQVESMRRWLRERDRDSDALLLTILAYAGVRPGEALALRWHDIQTKTLIVERSVALGTERSTKTGASRVVKLITPLREDLVRHRGVRRPFEGELVFPRPDGDPWHETDWRNWRRRVFAPAAEAAGAGGSRPYDLRHSFVSLLIHEGRSVVEVAAQAGHSPQTCLSTYAHVFAEFDYSERMPAEQTIRLVRQELEDTASSGL